MEKIIMHESREEYVYKCGVNTFSEFLKEPVHLLAGIFYDELTKENPEKNSLNALYIALKQLQKIQILAEIDTLEEYLNTKY